MNKIDEAFEEWVSEYRLSSLYGLSDAFAAGAAYAKERDAKICEARSEDIGHLFAQAIREQNDE